MIVTETSTHAHRSIRKVLIAASSLAVVASFVAAPAAVAATPTSHPGAVKHVALKSQLKRPTISKHQVRHHPAPAAVHNKAAIARRAGLIKHAKVKITTSTVRTHPAKPASIAALSKTLPAVTPSYRLAPNVRRSPDVVTNITGACQVVAGNHSGVWSPASCPNGYEVQGDVVVPVGKTLTVKPNTDVYFDTTVAGSLTPGDVSELTDLRVNGTLTVAGTAAEPVTFTSANAAPNSGTEPQAGDWGYVFFNHTGSNAGGGSLTHLRLQYGEGIAADRSAPAISSSTITNVAAGKTAPLVANSVDKGAGIDYEDIPGGKVSLANDTFDGSDVAGLVFRSVYDHTAFNGSASAGHAFTLAITGSRITGGLTSGYEDAILADSETAGTSAASNVSGVTLNVHDNHITDTEDGYALDIQAENEPAAIAGSAAITGAFHDNVINTGDSGYGVNFNAYAADSTKTGPKACLGASACVVVPFVNDKISSYRTAVTADAEVNSGAGSSLVKTTIGAVKTTKVKKVVKKHGKKHKVTVIKHVDVSGGSMTSADSDGWDIESYDNGTGVASVSMPIVKTTVEAEDDAISVDSESNVRNATASVPIKDSTITSHDDSAVVLETDASKVSAPPSGTTGNAGAAVSVTNSTLQAYDQDIYFDDTYSYYGAASSSSTVTDSTLTSSDGTNVENDTYSSTTGGSGGATAKAVITGSHLTAYYTSVDNEIYAYHGTAPATSTVDVTKSSLSDYDDDAIESDAYAAYSSGSHGNAATHVNVKSSNVQAYDYGLSLDTYSYYGGSATSSPTITNSTVTTSEYAIENYVYAADNGGSGAATGNPAISGSTIDAYEYDIYNDVESNYGSGTATGNPTITKSSSTSADDYLIYNEVSGTDQAGSSGKAVCNPQLVGGTAVANEYLIYNECYGYYGSASGSPLIKNVNGLAGDDYGIYNEVYGTEDGGSGGATGSPRIVGTSLLAEDYAIYNEVYAYRGNGVANPSISSSDVTAADDYAIYNEVYSDYSGSTNGHTATGSPTISASTVDAYYYGIYNEVFGDYGPAVGSPVVSGSTIKALDDYAVYNEVYGSDDGGAGSGTGSPVFSKSTILSSDYALYNEVYGEHGAAHANPVFSHTPMKALFEGDIYNEAFGYAGSATAYPKVTSSPMSCGDCSSEDALFNEAESANASATANPTVTSSPIRNAYGYGVYNEAYGANTTGTGTATANPVLTSSPVSAYYDALYNDAESYNGNSPANASFTVTNSYLRTTDDEAIYVQGEGNGTGKTTINPAISGSTLRATDDDGMDIYGYARGTGATSIGGHVKSTTVVSEGDGLYEALEPSAASPGTVTTSFTNNQITVMDDNGIDISATAVGASETLTPTITGGSITASDDSAIETSAGGRGGSATDVLKAAPVISGVKALSEDGIEITAEDSGSPASPGRVVVGGSVTNSSVTATDSEGVEAYAYCSYCEGGAQDTFRLANTPVHAYDEGLYTEAYVSPNGTGSAVLGGSAKTTHGYPLTALDDYGIYVYAYAALGNVTNTFAESGYAISGYDGPFDSYTYAGNGNASRTLSISNSALSNLDATSDEDGIYDATYAIGAGHNATVKGSVSGNTISDLPDSEGIDVYASAPNQALFGLTIAHNSISNVGDSGIYVDSSAPTLPGQTNGVTISHNTITKTGEGGIYLYGVKPVITANKISNTGLGGGTTSDRDAVYVAYAPFQGSATCNVIFGNRAGIEYYFAPVTGSSGHDGDPTTNDNSFKDPGSSLRNSVDLVTNNTGSGKTNAQANFWGGNPRLGANASKFDTAGKLKGAPACTKTAGV